MWCGFSGQNFRKYKKVVEGDSTHSLEVLKMSVQKLDCFDQFDISADLYGWVVKLGHCRAAELYGFGFFFFFDILVYFLGVSVLIFAACLIISSFLFPLGSFWRSFSNISSCAMTLFKFAFYSFLRSACLAMNFPLNTIFCDSQFLLSHVCIHLWMQESFLL